MSMRCPIAVQASATPDVVGRRPPPFLLAQTAHCKVEEIVALHGGLMDSITREEVNAWAAKVLPAANCRAAAIVPKAFVGILEGASR